MRGNTICGIVHKYGDNINTDIISPAQYMEHSYEIIAQHVMEGIDSEFSKNVKQGDIVVAGKNFGSGSSRETAPIALLHVGIGAIIAEFFARIFYRNAINIGLPVIECKYASQIADKDKLEVNLLNGIIRNITQGEEYSFIPYPSHILEIIRAGGLVQNLENNFLRKN
ncbi:MAG: 3-isopropylmalate dehydratase small subunit [Peptococcaceae bacterium]